MSEFAETVGGLKQRIKHEPDFGAGASLHAAVQTGADHPAGPIKHSGLKQAALMVLFGLFFISSAVCIHIVQLAGTPLYFISRPRFYQYMSMTKAQFGLFINSITHWWSPTVIRVSGDEDLAAQMELSKDGRLVTKFPNRLVMIANHQIYTDWLYLWWISYTSEMHGHLYIILKESLKYIPLVGPGMMFYGFIFMARKWATDKPRIKHRLEKLNKDRTDPSTGSALDPMWLLIFPEGTNLSTNGRRTSSRFAEKSGLADMQHQLLPRSTGLQFCLQELKETVHWVYDCTIAYEGIPRGEYGQDIYTLRSIYFQGRAPKSVNMYWRRFKTSEIPIDDPGAFETWLRDRWTEKDKLLEQYMQTGRFPPNRNATKLSQYLETEVKPKKRFEVLNIFAPTLIVFGAASLILKAFEAVLAAFGTK